MVAIGVNVDSVNSNLVLILISGDDLLTSSFLSDPVPYDICIATYLNKILFKPTENVRALSTDPLLNCRHDFFVRPAMKSTDILFASFGIRKKSLGAGSGE